MKCHPHEMSGAHIVRTFKILNKKAKVKYLKNNRIGDHIWYISDVSKFKKHYPGWEYAYNNDQIIEEICRSGHIW